MMRSRRLATTKIASLIVLCAILTACSRAPRPGASGAGTTAGGAQPALRDEIPADRLNEVVAAHLEGVGLMEQYQYAQAVAAFRKVHQLAPGWIAGSINLAIALLNDSGIKAEAAKGGRASATPPATNFDEALKLLDAVIERDPQNLHAHYCRGLILEYQGDLERAHKDFAIVTERDPSDAHAWLKLGTTLTDPENPGAQAGPKQARELIAIYTKALERNPYLVMALYKIQQAYIWAGEPKKQAEALNLWRRLNPDVNPAGPGDTGKTYYGEMGRYATVIDPFPMRSQMPDPGHPPRFDVPE
ncbi:MAG: tetratricopeptide repeat protein, partial [Isosphaeraceae bacterium]|nr:tetratricopeptide repeat protein [Isosphaeraceae bacterium]